MKKRAAAYTAAAFLVCGGIALAAPPKYCMGCDFKAQHLATADFSNGVYFGSNFAEADLSGASFRGARLIAANFSKANLDGASFDGADCLACNFSGAKTDGATFMRVRMAAANFSGFAARMDDVQLRNLLAGCTVCDFSKGVFTGYDLARLPLISIDFSGADLRQVRFDGATMCWYGGTGPKRAMACDKLAGAKLSGASFAGINVCDDPLDARTCTVLSDGDFRRNAAI